MANTRKLYSKSLKVCIKLWISIKLAFFLYGTYGCGVSLQAWSSILVLVPFRVYCIINLPIKYILVIINSDSIMIRSRNTGFHQSAAKCEKCEGSAKSVKEVQNRCERIDILIL